MIVVRQKDILSTRRIEQTQMVEMGSEGISPEKLLPRIVGDTCNYCESGTLARGEYKGSPAAVCTDCEVPQIRFF